MVISLTYGAQINPRGDHTQLELLANIKLENFTLKFIYYCIEQSAYFLIHTPHLDGSTITICQNCSLKRSRPLGSMGI